MDGARHSWTPSLSIASHHPRGHGPRQCDSEVHSHDKGKFADPSHQALLPDLRSSIQRPSKLFVAALAEHSIELLTEDLKLLADSLLVFLLHSRFDGPNLVPKCISLVDVFVRLGFKVAAPIKALWFHWMVGWKSRDFVLEGVCTLGREMCRSHCRGGYLEVSCRL
jgi:hypothetical protein